MYIILEQRKQKTFLSLKLLLFMVLILIFVAIYFFCISKFWIALLVTILTVFIYFIALCQKNSLNIFRFLKHYLNWRYSQQLYIFQRELLAEKGLNNNETVILET